jgi:alkylmercury lyase
MSNPTDTATTPASAINELVHGYLAGMPELDSSTAQIAVSLWRYLALGAPVARDALAERLGLTSEQIDKALDGPLAGTFMEDDAGRIRAFWALSLADQPSPHRLTLDDRTLYAWCAPDTLFLPLLLGRPLLVESTLTTTDDPIRLEVHPDRLGDVHGPADTTLSFVPAATEGLGDSPAAIMSTYCHHQLFFPDTASGRRWAREHNRGELVFLPLAEAFDACQRLFRTLLGEALDDEQP